MNQPIPRHVHYQVSDVYQATIAELAKHFHRHTHVRILVVVDGSISLTEGNSMFGVARVVRLLRESHVGCTHFSVDLARREGPAATNANPGPTNPRYTGFRFDLVEGGAPALDRYQEVWCFGFNPDNFAGNDTNITQPGALPASDQELKALTRWMNEKRGGLLAMGDHDYLGASMCHRIPRIRSMRRWTNAQGVPPIGGQFNPDTHLRHDTNQPATPDQINNGGLIPFAVQEDTLPQKIEWVPWLTQQINIFRLWKRPHPILCHPHHGPIDVMPDHPHEGWLFENHEINVGATYQFGDYSGDEYPTVNGQQPRPMLIAYGHTTPNPPFNLAKGPSPAKRFGMIGVYDGRPANVGRVVTDSTWHHWFDENIQNIEAAGGVNWDKISRYYLNVATWLAPPTTLNYCLVFEVIRTHFTYLGFQEYTPKGSVFDLGIALHTHLVRYLGPCWVSEWVLDQLQRVDADFWAWLKDRLFWSQGMPKPGTGPCLSCPPFELIEIAVLGGLVKASFPVANAIRDQLREAPDREHKFDADALAAKLGEGTAIGLKEFRAALSASVKDMQALLR